MCVLSSKNMSAQKALITSYFCTPPWKKASSTRTPHPSNVPITLTSFGKVNIKNAEYKTDEVPLDPESGCMDVRPIHVPIYVTSFVHVRSLILDTGLSMTSIITLI